MAIISKLDNCGWLFCQHEALKQLYRFFETCLQGKYKKRDYENGIRIDLDSGIFAMLQTYKLKPYKRAFFETHKEYVDFQLTIHGSECFMIGDSKDFKIIESYNAEKDLIVYKSKKSTHRIISNTACLCVFFPNDVHAGGLKHKNITDNKVYKIVAKVPKTLLESYIVKSCN
ncbi:MAG: YhcH/YjgK/YiaL family protein [Helicobacter sp.]|uniref:YhcH/YjgK/YiaL family protein n=1 Tax=Helicobacter sp. TaxID=218 RepID=UPI002A9115E6|nr:YhcH/YjgK/YiaL family protein [Helicobacter sp.]MDY5821445.1 YhcH/YjgK/YiaL family protein [Helicobacter sp.]